MIHARAWFWPGSTDLGPPRPLGPSSGWDRRPKARPCRSTLPPSTATPLCGTPPLADAYESFTT
eukprot:5259836-Pyramimonas_sp.AAC.1